MTSLHAVVARPTELPVEFIGGAPVAGFGLVDGQAVLLVVSVEPVNHESDQMIANALAAVNKQVANKGVD